MHKLAIHNHLQLRQSIQTTIVAILKRSISLIYQLKLVEGYLHQIHRFYPRHL